MKNLFKLLALVLAIVPGTSFAALLVTQGVQGGAGTSPQTLALTSSVSIGQVIIVSGPGFVNCSGAPTVNDSVNSGNYTLLQSYGSPGIYVLYKVANAAGTPTITVTCGANYLIAWQAIVVSGFAGTPTADSALANTATGTSATMAIGATSNHANEIILAAFAIPGGSYISSQPSGWTEFNASQSATWGSYYAIEAASGTPNNFSAGLNASDTWYIALAGIYDSGGGAAPVQGGFAISPSN